MLQRLDDMIGASLDVITCERGHRMSHGQWGCERCPEPAKPGLHAEEAKPEILNEDEWLLGARHRLGFAYRDSSRRLNKEAEANPADHEHGQCRFGDGCYAKIEPKEGELTELEAIVERAVQHMQAKEQAKISDQGKPDPKLVELLPGCHEYQTPNSPESDFGAYTKREQNLLLAGHRVRTKWPR